MPRVQTAPMQTQAAPSPATIMEIANSYQRTYALKAAVELDLFSAIGKGCDTVERIATASNASQRGCRTLCDFLSTLGLLEKRDDRYRLTPESALFLDRRSPACIASAVQFLTNPFVVERASQTTQVVRDGTLAEEHSSLNTHDADVALWTLFATSMAPLQRLPAQIVAELAPLDAASASKVLDIAAGHGAFGIAVARRFPQARIVAQDWPAVLKVARENAGAAGVAERFEELAGDAFAVEFGQDYDLVLIPNFLHHFNAEKATGLLRKAHAALKPGGCVIVVDFITNPDRVSPPFAARFAYTMLTTTPDGDVYTEDEYAGMFQNAGFPAPERCSLEPSPQSALVAKKT